MESLRLSFESVAPIFLLMLLGYVLRSAKVAEKKTFDAINALVFKIFLPILLFYNIYKTESAQVFDGGLVAFTIVSVLCVFLLGLALVLILSRDNAKRGVMLQGFFRSNFAILGVPLVHYMCGDSATGLASLMVAIVVPLFNVLSVISLEIFKGKKIPFKKMLADIIKNPLIIGCFLGALCFVMEIKLPSVVEKAVGDVAKIASPLALVVLGAGFTFSSIQGCLREILITVSARLIIVPLLVLFVAAALGFRGETFACLLVTFASPVAVSSFAMAQQMGGDEQLAGQVVVISSALCLVTLFVWIFVLNAMRLL